MDKTNTVTQKQIADWKKEYGHVYRTRLGATDVFWHKLRRKEYVDIMTADYTEEGQARIFARQDRIVKAATLWPEDVEKYIDGLAGFSTSIADEIMDRSGFNVAETEEL